MSVIKYIVGIPIAIGAFFLFMKYVLPELMGSVSEEVGDTYRNFMDKAYEAGQNVAGSVEGLLGIASGETIAKIDEAFSKVVEAVPVTWSTPYMEESVSDTIIRYAKTLADYQAIQEKAEDFMGK